MELNDKLLGQLHWLFKTYKAGSRGLLYTTLGNEDSVPKAALTRVKRLCKKGLAEFVGNTQGCQVYRITAEGLKEYKEALLEGRIK